MYKLIKYILAGLLLTLGFTAFSNSNTKASADVKQFNIDNSYQVAAKSKSNRYHNWRYGKKSSSKKGKKR